MDRLVERDDRVAAELLRKALDGGRTASSVEAVDLILGHIGSLDAFATQAELGTSLSRAITPAGTNQLLNRLHDSWAGQDDTLSLLRTLERVVDAARTAQRAVGHELPSSLTRAGGRPVPLGAYSR